MLVKTLAGKSISRQVHNEHLSQIQSRNEDRFNKELRLQQIDRNLDQLFPSNSTVFKKVSIQHFPQGMEVHINENYECYSEPDVRDEYRGVRGEGEREDNKERAARRAKTNVRKRCKAIQADCMLTLTYREVVTDPKRVAADLKALVTRFRSLGAFEYVATLELQKRGALHVHIACQQFPAYLKNEHGVRVKSYQLISSMWSRIVGRGQGNVNFTRPRGSNSAHRVAAYIGKYVGKGIESAAFNAKSYWSSRGIVVPKPIKMVYPASMSTYDIVGIIARQFFELGLTDICQYADKLGKFYWFSANRPH